MKISVQSKTTRVSEKIVKHLGTYVASKLQAPAKKKKKRLHALIHKKYPGVENF